MEDSVQKQLDQTVPVAWQHNKELGDCMIELYDKRLWTDVKFRCQDHDESERIHAHKIVLAARSPVFQAMFFGPCANGKDDVQLENAEAKILDLFLRYIYCDTVMLVEETAYSVLEMAHYYQVTNLVKFCADYLASIITSENACEILSLALRYEVTTLLTDCCNFIDKHADDILKSEGFLELPDECLAYILKGDTFYADEDDIFVKAEEWSKRRLGEGNFETTGPNTRKELGASFHYLRLPTMTYQTLMECTRKKGYFSVEEYEDIVDFINEIPDSSVKSNSCVTRLPTEEILEVNKEDGATNISDNITTSFQVSVSRDVKLKNVTLTKIHKYLKYDDTLYSARNSKISTVTDDNIFTFFSNNNNKTMKLKFVNLEKKAYILKKVPGQELSEDLNIVISGNIQITCRKIELLDVAVRGDEGKERQNENEEVDLGGNRSRKDSDQNENESNENSDDDDDDEEEDDDEDEEDDEYLIFEQDVLLQSNEVAQRVIDLKEPLALTEVGSPYKVTVNLKYSCECGVQMKTLARSTFGTVTSEYGHIEVDNILGRFAGIKSLGFENTSNRYTVK